MISVSVSKNLVSEKKFRFRFQNFWSRKKSIGIGFGKNLVSEKSLGIGFGQNFGIVIQCHHHHHHHYHHHHPRHQCNPPQILRVRSLMTTKSVIQATWPGISITPTGMVWSGGNLSGSIQPAFYPSPVPTIIIIIIIIARDYRTSGSAGVCAQECRVLPWCQSFSFRCPCLFFRRELSTSKKDFLRDGNVSMSTWLLWQDWKW